jgi:hypothetical protein
VPVRGVAGDGWHLGVLVLVTTSGLSVAARAGLRRDEDMLRLRGRRSPADNEAPDPGGRDNNDDAGCSREVKPERSAEPFTGLERHPATAFARD